MNEIRPWIKSGQLFSESDTMLKRMNLSDILIQSIKEIKLTKDIKYVNEYKKNIPCWIQDLIRPDYLDIKKLKHIIDEHEINSEDELLQIVQAQQSHSLFNDLLLRILTYTNSNNFPYEFLNVFSESDSIKSFYRKEKVKGIIHNHTTYSDGMLNIPFIVKEAQKNGYEYIGISDHSSSTMLGMELIDIKRQIEEIKKQRSEDSSILIFHGLECEILPNGELDFAPNILSNFDYIIAGIHTNYGMSKEEATQRVIKAVSNPFCDILAHPECRILGSEPGLILDTKKIIDLCVENSVVIEINGNHKRLDLDPKYINYAIDKGAFFELAADVHKTNDFKKINNSILIAEHYSIPEEKIINLFDSDKLKSFFKYLHDKKRRNMSE